MSKKRKTLKQKIYHDERQEKLPVTYSYSLPRREAANPQKTTIQSVMPVRAIDTTQYAYLGHDLRKTIFLTSAIVILELVLTFYL